MCLTLNEDVLSDWIAVIIGSVARIIARVQVAGVGDGQDGIVRLWALAVGFGQRGDDSLAKILDLGRVVVVVVEGERQPPIDIPLVSGQSVRFTEQTKSRARRKDEKRRRSRPNAGPLVLVVFNGFLLHRFYLNIPTDISK